MKIQNAPTAFTLGTFLLIAFVSTNAGSQACSLSASAARSGGLPCTQVLLSSGQQWMDQGYEREIYFLDRILGVNPAFRLCVEKRGPNAFASPEISDPNYRDGTVYFGATLMRSELSESGATTNFSIPAIMAHEFAHILQFKHGVQLPTKLKELQADYIAGWFMSNRDRFSGWSAQSFHNTLQSFFDKGDYAFNSPTHHGTPSERADAITQGFKSGTEPLALVFQQSYAYVSQLGTGEPLSPERGGAQQASHGHEPNGQKSEANIDATSLSGILQKLLNSKGDFAEFKGQKDPDGDGTEWLSTLSVSGAVECTVTINRGFNAGQSFSCKMAESTDTSDADASFNHLVAAIQQSLPQGWRRQDNWSNGKLVHRSAKFERSSSDPWISVELSGSHKITTDFTVFSPDQD